MILSTRICLFTNMAYEFAFQVTGKALMLDEIINYVQSLQRQVEVKLTYGSIKVCDFFC